MRIGLWIVPGLLLFSFTVQAAAFIDPPLRTRTGRMKVIVLFKNRLRPVKNLQASTSYLRSRRHLADNARVSQQNFLADMEGQAALSASPADEIQVRSLWLLNAAVVELPAAKLAVLENHPDVTGVYANHKLSIIRDFSEKALKIPAAMNADYTYGLNLLNIPRLRSEEPRADGKGILVGLIDTGVDASHPDLLGKVVGFRDFVETKGRTSPYDNNGHGTHVSGTVVGGNRSGKFIGVAPGAKLLVAKAFSGSGQTTLDAVLGAMQWMSDPDGRPETADEPSLVTNSWGGGSANSKRDPTEEILCRAVSAWVDLGIFPIFAVGNAGPHANTVGIPAACPDAFAVGSSDERDALAFDTARGPVVWRTTRLIKPNVVAPGVAVISSFPGNQYRSISGTSMAAPHVAGMLALIYQVAPTISVGDAADLVGRTTKDLGPPGNDNDSGWGRIDAFEATRAAVRRRHLQ